MANAPPTLRRWKRVEYERLVDLGLFRGDPVELMLLGEPSTALRGAAGSRVAGP